MIVTCYLLLALLNGLYQTDKVVIDPKATYDAAINLSDRWVQPDKWAHVSEVTWREYHDKSWRRNQG